eukprot:6202447-Pleurochrysis_carterae.AAC.2
MPSQLRTCLGALQFCNLIFAESASSLCTWREWRRLMDALLVCHLQRATCSLTIRKRRRSRSGGTAMVPDCSVSVIVRLF